MTAGALMSMTLWISWLVATFLIGAIPFAVLIGRAHGVDIRVRGSGNPGASNLGRQVGKKWGILCFLLDVGKGLVPTLSFGLLVLIESVSRSFGYREAAAGPTGGAGGSLGAGLALQWVLIAVAAVCGHVFSPFLKFKGGKGVATGLGGTLGLFPVVTVPAMIGFAIWYAVCKLTGYVGLASVVAAGSLPILTAASGLLLGLSGGETAVFVGLTALLAGLVIWRHRGNLARIRAGTEPKAAWTGKHGSR
jgi:glycerol-3-phosphate acyltransferase PlsY